MNTEIKEWSILIYMAKRWKTKRVFSQMDSDVTVKSQENLCF